MPPDLPESRRDAYVTHMAAQLRELNEALDGLEARVAAAEGEARAKARQGLAGLREQARAVAAKLDAVRTAEASAWDRLMTEMDTAWTDFRHSANFFESQL